MASLLAQLAEATRSGKLQPMVKRGPVSVYDPQRAIQQTLAPRQQQAPARVQPSQRTTTRQQDAAARGGQRINWAGIEDTLAANPQAQKLAAQRAQQTAPKPDLPWYEDVLGVALGNPITKGVMNAMAPLSVGRKLVTLGAEEAAERLPDWAQGGLSGIIDTQRTEADKRSNWEKLAPNSDYGFGQLLDPDLSPWVSRPLGFLGDVALDPLTYATAGAYKVVETTAKAGKAAKALEEANVALRAAEAAGAHPDEIARLGEAATAAQRAATITREVPIHGARGRRALIADYLTKNPEAPPEVVKELLRGGERGLNTLSPETRKLVGVAEPALRFRGVGLQLPGTGKATELASEGAGAIRAGYNKLPLAGKVFRGPKGLEDATRVLSRGGEGDPFKAALITSANNAIRAGRGQVQAGGNRNLVRLVRDVFNKMPKAEIRQMLVDSELKPGMTPINERLQMIRQVYERISGDVIPSSVPEEFYVPHLLAPGARRMLRDNAGDPAVEAFKKFTGFRQEDLLEGSAFAEKARVFRSNADGTPQTFKLGDKELVVERGNIDELNTKLGELFPGFKGKFYQDDPVHIIESYVDSLSRGAGAHAGRNFLADSATPMVQRVEGPLAEGLKARNEALAAQFPAADLVKQGPYDPTVGVVPEGGVGPVKPVPTLATPPEIPTDVAGVHLPDYFRSTASSEGTADLYKTAQGPARTYAKAVAADVKEGSKSVRDTLADIRADMAKPLEKAENKADKLIPQLDDAIKQSRKELTDIVAEAGPLHEQLTTFKVGIRHEIDEMERQLAQQDRYFRGLTTKERNRVIKKVRSSLETLRQLRDEAETRIRQLPPSARAQAARLEDELYTPLEAAKDALDRAEAEAVRRVGRPSPRALEQARQVMAGNDEVYWSQIREEYQQAREVLAQEGRGELPKTASGKLTAQARRDLEAARQVVSEAEAARRAPVSPAEVPYAEGAEEAAARQRLDEIEKELDDLRKQKPRTKASQDKRVAAQARLGAEQRELNAKFRGRTTDFPPGEFARRRIAQEEAGAAARAERETGVRRGPGNVPPRAGSPLDPTFKPGQPVRGELSFEEQARRAGSRQYDLDEQALYDIDEQIRRRGAAVPKELRQQRRVLQAKFNPGGEHYAETYARQTLAHEAEAQHALRNVDPKLQAEVDKQRWVLNVQEKQVKQQAANLRQFATDYPVTEGRKAAGYQARVEENLGRMEAMGEPEIGPPVPARTRRGRPWGFDPERDVEIPGRIAEERDAIMGPVQERADLLHQARDAVVERTTKRLDALDEENIGLQAELARDMSDKQSLVTKRDQVRTIRPVLAKADPRKGTIYELSGTLDAIEGVAKANPLLDDASLTATESLLQTERQTLEQLHNKDMLARNVRAMTRAANNKSLGPVMLTTLNDNWHMLHEGVLKEGSVIIDAELHAMFKNLLVINTEPGLFGRVFNSLTNLFKTYATLSPGFHVRNALSGIFMNTSDGVALARQLEGSNLWGKYMKGGDEWLQTQSPRIQEAFKATTATGAGGRFTEAGVASLSADIKTPGLAKVYDRLASNRLTRFSQRWGERVEGALRLGMALDSVDRGEPWMDAVDRITRVHFDYSQTSRLDDQMKRIIPFWTYMSRNLPLQITQMWTKPGLYANYESFVRNFSQEPDEFTPQYWLDQGAFNTGLKVPDNNLPILGAASGLPIYMQPDFGYNRLKQDIESFKSPSKFAAQMNPLLTTGFEYAGKTDFYTGRKFDPNTDYEKASGIFNIPTNIIASLLGKKNAAGEVESNLVNALRGVNPVLDRSQRLFPNENPEGAKRQAESYLRFIGVPVRNLTDKQRDAEFFRRYYAQVDALKAQEASARRAAS